MARKGKHTMRKGKPLGEGKPESSRKLLRMENVAREATRMYQYSVPQKGKEVVESWEEEIKEERGSKEMETIAQEVDWIKDMGVTHTRETLFHKTLEMAWITKMLIGKVKAKRDEARKEEQVGDEALAGRHTTQGERVGDHVQNVGGHRKKPTEQTGEARSPVSLVPEVCPSFGHNTNR
jgi:hypothetical protein